MLDVLLSNQKGGPKGLHGPCQKASPSKHPPTPGNESRARTLRGTTIKNDGFLLVSFEANPKRGTPNLVGSEWR